MNIILLLLILVSTIVYLNFVNISQLNTSKCLIKKREHITNYVNKSKLPDYSNFINSNTNINNVLRTFCEFNCDSNCVLDNIIDNFTYSSSNLESTVKNKAMKQIKGILAKINKNNETNYKFLEIDRIQHKINIIDDELIKVVFTVSEVNKYTSYRLVLQFLIKNNTYILCFIRTLQNTINYNNIEMINNLNVKKYENITQEKPKNYNKEPCKFNLHEWDNNGVNYQLRTHPHCNINNSSDNTQLYTLYDNPTIFSN
mgnify:FL=1